MPSHAVCDVLAMAHLQGTIFSVSIYISCGIACFVIVTKKNWQKCVIYGSSTVIVVILFSIYVCIWFTAVQLHVLGCHIDHFHTIGQICGHNI
jgi:hypothetical protein